VIANNTLERRTALWDRVLRDGARYVFVAVNGAGDVAGFVSGGAMPAEIRGRAPIQNHDAYVDALYVLAAAHGAGTGRALLGTLALRLYDRGFRALALHVVADNPAVRFYEHLGATFIHDEPLAIGVDEGMQSAYGWADLAVSAVAIASVSSRKNDDASITIPKL
jgi:ribosomal protein S18 acetylase RimI-like enzyme